MDHQDIREALQNFEVAVRQGDGAGIAAALERLDELLAVQRDTLPPQLVHFLEGRSYAKALLWLGGSSEFARPASPPGGCGGGGHRH